MAFVLYKQDKMIPEGICSINNTGTLSFNKEIITSDRLDIYIDKKENKLGIKFNKKGTYKVSNNLIRSLRATTRIKGALKELGYNFSKHSRFNLTKNNDMYVIDLNNPIKGEK